MKKKKKGRPDLEKYLDGKGRKFVDYAQGAKLYNLPYWSFVRVAKEADANYPIRKTAIVDLDILENFLKDHPEVVKRLEETRRRKNEK
ncbi:MAG: hypothetical protein IIV45_03280 [Lachnospiraceae bacterium]|nr:hypothetical protein [Lachnospiraceae bacterium]